jgi:para-nitrobenzyl esterase
MTDKAPVGGLIHDCVREFKGNPYAIAPTGDLRSALLRAPAAWTQALNATAFRGGCPQVARYGLTEAGNDEDCLFVNVTALEKRQFPARKRPAIVWIDGGAFASASSALYPLGPMARSGDAVVVSFNYRLGVFGFLSHPAFERASYGGYGLEDERTAARWVQHKIAVLGGDPSNVTIAGKSAWPAPACMHVLGPDETTGRFKKAIVHSAGCAQHMRTVEDGGKIGQQVATLAGCAGSADTLACMRAKPLWTTFWRPPRVCRMGTS